MTDAATKEQEFDKGSYLKTIQDRYDSLTKRKEEIHAVAEPLREKRDTHVNQAREVEFKMNAEIAEAEKGLFAIDQERAMLARQLPSSRNAG